MILSATVRFIFIVALSAYNELSSHIPGNNGVKIQDMMVRILTALLMTFFRLHACHPLPNIFPTSRR